MSRLIHALKLLNLKLTNIAKHLCHCMLVNQLQCMTPTERFGFLLLWYVSIMEQLSSMHQQWFHILSHAKTPSWTQCQGGWHCPKWHNCHTAGSNRTLLLSGTTCTTTTCTTYAAPTCCTCNTSNPDEPSPSYPCHASCSKECPSANIFDIPCTPVQPWRVGCAHMAPRCLIQEIWELSTQLLRTLFS